MYWRLFFNNVAGDTPTQDFLMNFAKYLRTCIFSRTPPMAASVIVFHYVSRSTDCT